MNDKKPRLDDLTFHLGKMIVELAIHRLTAEGTLTPELRDKCLSEIEKTNREEIEKQMAAEIL